VFNAIPDIGTARPDFLDRARIVDFLDIKPEMRRDEGRFWRGFEQVRPRILGARLDAVVAGLGRLPIVRLDQLPRMADLAIWVAACEETLGMTPSKPRLLTSSIAPTRTIRRLNPHRYRNLFPNWLRRAFAGQLDNCSNGSTA
jgi:hypothetical protein